MTEHADREVATTCYRHPDRETGLSCSNCGRPICAECMTPTPVGQRCPECVGRQEVRRPRSMARVTPVVTYALIAACVLAFFVLQGGGMGTVSRINALDAGAIYGPAIADGEWWRVITGAFLHGSLLHLGFNMYALYLFGPILETRHGHFRFAALYLVGGVWGSAGALLLDPDAYTVGASGAIFGLLAAMFVAERRHGVPMMGGVGVWIVLNLVITFAIPGISVGGHIGGLIGGGLAGVILEATARRRSTPLAFAGIAALLAAAGVATIVAVG